MNYIVRFNCAEAISKMPRKRRDWERQLVDDFLQAIHGIQYECGTREELIRRLGFIAGRGGHGIQWDDEKNHVKLDSPAYGERLVPAKLYGFAQGYVNFNHMVELLERGKTTVFVRFNDFYDIRQRPRFNGCYLEVIRVA